MISKGYHYVINLDIASNFHINIDPAYHGACARGSIIVAELRGMGFPLAIDPRAHYPRRVLTGHNWNDIYKLVVFYFQYPCPFYP